MRGKVRGEDSRRKGWREGVICRVRGGAVQLYH